MNNTKILITGSNGFIGKNLTAHLTQLGYNNLYLYDRDSTIEDLNKYCTDCEFVFNLAGINRPLDAKEFYEGNKDFSKTLIDTLKKHNNNSPIVISSSIQATLDNDYGKSKKMGEDLFLENDDNKAFIFRLYGVFGKWSKPNYNTVVATFMYNIINDLPVSISDESHILSLCYIDDVLIKFTDMLKNHSEYKTGFYEIDTLHKISLGQLYNLIVKFNENRKNFIMPALDTVLKRRLYGTFLSFLDKDDFGYDLIKNEDNRGWLAEFIKTRENGQIFISTTKPGITRGNHWHHTKTEKFFVIKGQAKISFRHILEDEVIDYVVSGDEPKVVDIPTGYTHSITNIGNEDMICLFWASEMFSKENPDTYYLEV